MSSDLDGNGESRSCCFDCSCSRTAGGADREEHSNAGGHRRRIAGFYTPSPRAPSHLPWVDEQEVPQPSQVLFHLKIKPPGQDTTYSRV